MQAGQMRCLITIEQNDQVQGSFGMQTKRTPYLQTWACISVLTSSEKYQFAQFTSAATHKVVIRYDTRKPISAKMQVVYEGRVFIIQAVTDPDERKREINLLCIELNT